MPVDHRAALQHALDASRDLRVRGSVGARLRGQQQECGDHVLVPRGVRSILKEVFARDKPGKALAEREKRSELYTGIGRTGARGG